ncbi:hypothetical protein GCM10009731_09450 [Streptomyces globosus]
MCEPALPAVSDPRLRPNMVDAPPCSVDLFRCGENAFDHAVGLGANRAGAPGMGVSPRSSRWECAQSRTASGHGHRPVGVGPQNGRAERPQAGERGRRGMPVAVPRADRDDRQPGPDPGVQLGVLVG